MSDDKKLWRLHELKRAMGHVRYGPSGGFVGAAGIPIPAALSPKKRDAANEESK